MIKIKNIKLFFAIVFFIKTSIVFSQDIHFSQFNVSPVLLNPAAAGASNSDFRFTVNYKNQWKSVISPFKTTAVAFDSKIYTSQKRKENHIGYGFTLYNDKAGLSRLTTNQANLDVAYLLFLNRISSLSVGVKAGVFQKSINTTNLKWDAQYDGKSYDASLSSNESMAYQSFMKFDLSVGIMYKYYSKINDLKFEFGGSMTHITKPKNSFYSKDPFINYKYIGHMNMQVKINESVFVLPAAMYALQGSHSEIIAGTNVRFIIGQQTREDVILNTFDLMSSALQVGAFYRIKDAFVFIASLDLGTNMSFGVSYDVNVSNLTMASRYRGGMEFSFVLKGLSNGMGKGSKNDR